MFGGTVETSVHQLNIFSSFEFSQYSLQILDSEMLQSSLQFYIITVSWNFIIKEFKVYMIFGMLLDTNHGV